MLVVMLFLIPVNFIVSPATPWWMVVLVAWGAPLAVHVAWATGWFGQGGKT